MDATSRRKFLTLLGAALVASACGVEGAGPTAPDPDAPPPTLPTEPELAGIQAVGHSYTRASGLGDKGPAVSGDQQLAADLYRLLAAQEAGNFIFSPFSIATAFSMLLVGAKGITATELADVLGATGTDWNGARNALDLAVRTPASLEEGAEPLELEIANAPFGQTGFTFEDNFIRVLAEQYGADMRSLNFAVDPDAARASINAWVADQTRDRIADLLPEGSIDELARLVLVNTVFFKATWVDEFDSDRTAARPFNLIDGSVVSVATMNGSSRTTYEQNDDWQMVRLRYWGGYSMTLLVPDQGAFAAVESKVADGLFGDLAAIRTDFQVTLALPKFDFKTAADLVPLFQALGAIDVFDPAAADLTGIADADLYLSGAFHQATIEVDELGTTATAATALVMSATSAPPSVSLTIDRPFLFAITHDETAEPLFIGRVLDPS